MIVIIGLVWFAFLCGFLGHAFFFPKIVECEVCPLCREQWKKDLDEWA